MKHSAKLILGTTGRTLSSSISARALCLAPRCACFPWRPSPLSSLRGREGATFFIVLLYWLRCTRCLWGYMALSCSVLLGLMGGAVWKAALDVFQLPCDVFTYYGVLWNFAAVGVVAIFYQKVERRCSWMLFRTSCRGGFGGARVT